MTNVHPTIQKFRKKFPTHVEISDRPGSYVVLRSQREQEELESFLLEVDKQAREEERENALKIAKGENRKHLQGRSHCICFEKTLRQLFDLQHQERKGDK